MLQVARVSLLEFLRTGVYGPIELGMSQTDVEHHLGPPECEVAGPRESPPFIWKYGDIEFHFQEDAVFLIFTDWFTCPVGGAMVPCGGAEIDLDPWIIHDRLTCAEAEQGLSKAAIPFHKVDFPYADNGIHLITDAGTRLGFCSGNGSDVMLYSVCNSAFS